MKKLGRVIFPIIVGGATVFGAVKLGLFAVASKFVAGGLVATGAGMALVDTLGVFLGASLFAISYLATRYVCKKVASRRNSQDKKLNSENSFSKKKKNKEKSVEKDIIKEEDKVGSPVIENKLLENKKREKNQRLIKIVSTRRLQNIVPVTAKQGTDKKKTEIDEKQITDFNFNTDFNKINQMADEAKEDKSSDNLMEK